MTNLQSLLWGTLGGCWVRSAEVHHRDGRHRLLHGLLRPGGGARRLQVDRPLWGRHRDPLRPGSGRAGTGGLHLPRLESSPDRVPPALAR